MFSRGVSVVEVLLVIVVALSLAVLGLHLMGRLDQFAANGGFHHHPK